MSSHDLSFLFATNRDCAPLSRAFTREYNERYSCKTRAEAAARVGPVGREAVNAGVLVATIRRRGNSLGGTPVHQERKLGFLTNGGNTIGTLRALVKSGDLTYKSGA